MNWQRSKSMKKIDAHYLLKTMSWVCKKCDCKSHDLEPKLNKHGFYECKIYLPILDKIVVGLGETKIDSIDNVTKQSSLLIDEYLQNNPDVLFENEFKNKPYILEEDDSGNLVLCITKKGAHC